MLPVASRHGGDNPWYPVLFFYSKRNGDTMILAQLASNGIWIIVALLVVLCMLHFGVYMAIRQLTSTLKKIQDRDK